MPVRADFWVSQVLRSQWKQPHLGHCYLALFQTKTISSTHQLHTRLCTSWTGITGGLVKTCFCSQHKRPRLHLHASAMPKSTHLRIFKNNLFVSWEWISFLFPFSSLNLFLIYWGDDSEDNSDNNNVAIVAALYSGRFYSQWWGVVQTVALHWCKLFHIVLNDLHITGEYFQALIPSQTRVGYVFLILHAFNKYVKVYIRMIDLISVELQKFFCEEKFTCCCR